jgi:hypothetical protein
MFLKNLPKIAHCFWYSPSGLPYLRFISIASFAVHNPEFNLIIYTTDEPLGVGKVFDSHEQGALHVTKDYMSLLLRFRNVTFVKLDKLPIETNGALVTSAVHWSDILRIHLLATVGGFWIDSDIIFTRPISTSYIASREHEHVDTIISQTSLGAICPYMSHRIGFLGSSEGNEFFGALLAALKREHNNSSEYQVFGANLYNKIFPSQSTILSTIKSVHLLNLPNSCLYSILLTELLSRRIEMMGFIACPFVIGCHWYGGGDHLNDIIQRLNSSDHPEITISEVNREKNIFLLNLFQYADRLVFVDRIY